MPRSTINGATAGQTHFRLRGLLQRPEHKVSRRIVMKWAVQVQELVVPVDVVLKRAPLQLAAARVVGVRLGVVRA